MKLRAKRAALENAVQLLPRQARQFFKRGDKTAQEGPGPAEVHRFRVLTKRFRYVLEYFSPCYGQALQAYLELLKELQATLGALNDCVATRELLVELLEAGDPPRRHKKLFAALERRQEQLLAEFLEEWSRKFADSELRGRWDRYLAHPPPRRPQALAKSAK